MNYKKVIYETRKKMGLDWRPIFPGDKSEIIDLGTYRIHRILYTL